MNSTLFLRKLCSGAAFVLLLFGTLFGLNSCKDEVDASNLVTKTEATVWDYIDSVAIYSDYAALLRETHTGDTADANSSSLASFVSGYGNFTVLAPDNEAIANYVMEATGGATSDWHQLSAEDKQYIAENSIIDHGDEPAYAQADFPTTGTFSLGTLDNRLLTIELTDDNQFLIEGTAHVVRPDIKLKNGYIHGVDAVIAPSQSTIADLIATADNMQIFTVLLQRTGWADSLSIPYEDPNFSADGYPESAKYQYNSDAVPLVDERYRGFTIFAETDSVFVNSDWAIAANFDEAGELTNPDEVIAQVEQQAAAVYGSANTGDYTNPDNPVNRFVAYHLLDGSMSYNKLVMHLNEFGYSAGTDPFNPQLNTFSVDVWDYYTTMGKTRCLLKVTQNGDLEDGVYPIYLNTAREYNNGRDGNYKVTAITLRGQKISATNGKFTNGAVNGFYYPIDGILVYDETVREKALAGRIRFDITTMCPELWTGNLRGRTRNYFTNEYFKNLINVAEDTKIFYLKVWQNGGVWYDYQGDEYMLQGIFDVTFRLPPVPTAGTYEVRMGVSNNTLRGMAQVYFGDNPSNLPPVGLPYDLRVNPSGYAGFDDYKESNPEVFAVIPWETDKDDEDENRTIEKNLRNAGYLKGPQYFNGYGNTTPARGNYACLRRIVTTQYMEPGKTYYIRYKTALEATDGQFFMDYFEYCPSYIYNGAEPEDIW